MSILVSGSLLSQDNQLLRLVTKKTLVNGYGSEIFESINFHLEVAFFNDTINEKIKFRKWICSQYSRDGFWCDQEKNKENEKAYRYLVESTRVIDRFKGRVVFHRENEVVTR